MTRRCHVAPGGTCCPHRSASPTPCSPPPPPDGAYTFAACTCCWCGGVWSARVRLRLPPNHGLHLLSHGALDFDPSTRATVEVEWLDDEPYRADGGDK